MIEFVTPETQADRQKNSIDRKNVIKQMLEVIAKVNRNSLSRGAPSTTRPPLRWGVPMAKRFGLQGVFGDLSKICLWAILQFLTLKSRTTQEPADTNGTFSTQSSLGMFRLYKRWWACR